VFLKFNRSSSIKTFYFGGYIKQTFNGFKIFMYCNSVYKYLFIHKFNIFNSTTMKLCQYNDEAYYYWTYLLKYIFILVQITDLSYSTISLPICVQKLSRLEIIRVNNVHAVFVRNEKIIITLSRKPQYSVTLKQNVF